MILPQDASNDQSNCPNGYYRNTSGMVMQIPIASEQPAAKPLSAVEIERLEGMTREELVGLVRASNAEYVGIGLMSQEEIKLSTRIRLAQIALRNPDDKVALQAIQQLLDRLEGKPVGTAQQININGSGPTKIEVVLVNAEQYRKQQDAARVIEHQLNPIPT